MEKLQKAYRLYDPKYDEFVSSNSGSVWLQKSHVNLTKRRLSDEKQQRVEIKEYYLIETSRFSLISKFFEDLKELFSLFQLKTSLNV